MYLIQTVSPIRSTDCSWSNVAGRFGSSMCIFPTAIHEMPCRSSVSKYSAAVLGVDGAIRPKPYKTAVAVATVVIFGTLSMFLYPILYRAGIFDLSPEMMGLFTGATVHEVAHVVGASNAMGTEVSNTAIIVKMIRVMMLVPVLLVIAWTVAKKLGKACSEDTEKVQKEKARITIPWFAILFLVVIGFNSLGLLPENVVALINQLDTFLLTLAVT